jgi:uncharacterized protein
MTPYVAPFLLYLGLTQIPPLYPESYAVLYSTVVVVVGLATLFLVRGRGLLRPHLRIAPGILIGVIGIVLWIALCRLDVEQQVAGYLPSFLRPSPRAGFDPFGFISNPLARAAFLVARLFGLVVLVPIVEELFWRGFLLRWLVSPDWQAVPVGRYTPFSFLGVTLLFTLAHPEWLAAAVYCALLNGLIYWTRDLWNCIVAHAVSNLLLAGYILTTSAWQLW